MWEKNKYSEPQVDLHKLRKSKSVSLHVLPFIQNCTSANDVEKGEVK